MPEIVKDSVSQSIYFRVADSNSGLPKVDVTSATPNLEISYFPDNGPEIFLTLSDLTSITDPYSSGGFIHRDAGEYRLDIPNSACVAANKVLKFTGQADGCVFYFPQYNIVPPNVSGNGAISCVLNIANPGSVPISDVDVWISTDLSGDRLATGTKRTDSFGNVTFWLDPGIYYRWCQKVGIEFMNPQTFTVT